MEHTSELSDREQTAWQLLLRVQAQLSAALDRELTSTHRLGLADHDVLASLSTSPDHSMRMTDLAHEVALSPSGLTRRLDILVKHSLIERQRCVTDGRGSMAVLTDGGADKLREMAPTHAEGVRKHFSSQLNEEQLDNILDIFSKLEPTSASSSILDVRKPA